jgi:hypothetical protein
VYQIIHLHDSSMGVVYLFGNRSFRRLLARFASVILCFVSMFGRYLPELFGVVNYYLLDTRMASQLLLLLFGFRGTFVT